MSGFLNPIVSKGGFQRADLAKAGWWGAVGPGNSTTSPMAYGMLENHVISDASSNVSTSIEGNYFEQRTGSASGDFCQINSNNLMHTDAGARYVHKFSLGGNTLNNQRFATGGGAGFQIGPTFPEGSHVAVTYYTNSGEPNFVFSQATVGGANSLKFVSSVEVTTDVFIVEIVTASGTEYTCSIYDADKVLLDSRVLTTAASLPLTNNNRKWGYLLDTLDGQEMCRLYSMWLGVSDE